MSESPIAFRLLESGDLDLSGFGLTPICPDINYAEQDIRHTLTLHFGEFFANKEIGVPWLDFLGKDFSVSEVVQKLREVMLSRPYVLEIFAVVPVLGTDRSVSIDYDLLTEYGRLKSTQEV